MTKGEIKHKYIKMLIKDANLQEAFDKHYINKQILIEIMDVLCRVTQLISGWNATESEWSTWDKQVYDEVLQMQSKINDILFEAGIESEKQSLSSENKELIRKLIASETRVVFLEKENERLKAEREWISVKDRLPDNGVYVIVRFKDGCIGIDYLASFYKGVTHWMPLPEPPKQ